MIFRVSGEKVRFLERDLKKQQISYELNADKYPNIVSSYCAEEVFRTGQWLHESEYHSVLDGFDYSPKLKINLSDSNQSFHALFYRKSQLHRLARAAFLVPVRAPEAVQHALPLARFDLYERPRAPCALARANAADRNGTRD